MDDPQSPLTPIRTPINPKSYNRRYRKAKTISGYAEEKPVGAVNKASPMTYKRRSVLESSQFNPLTRVKPLVPNILDKAQIDALNMNMAKRKESGHNWAIVQQR